MSATIKFFPLDKCKKLTPEEKRKLQVQQNMITGARNEMENRIKDMPPYWQVVERSLWHNMFRSRIKAVNEDT